MAQRLVEQARAPQRNGKRAGAERAYILGSAEHLLDLLVFMGTRGGERTISELSRQLGISFSRAYRLVATLEAKGFLERDPITKRYRIGLRAFEVGNQYLNGRTVLAQARPLLERLAAESRETAFLAIRDGRDVIYIDRVDSPQVVRFQTAIGSRAPWNCVAAGRALVSVESPQTIRELLAGPLGQCLSEAATDPDELERALRQARERGYALNLGDWHDDVAAVAAPVVDAAGRPIAALVLGAPRSRLPLERTEELGELLARTARLACLGPAGR